MNFEPLRTLVARRAAYPGHKFKVNHGGDLWLTFIFNLPESERLHYNCNACRHFVERYGSVISLSDTGERETLWDPEGVPEDFQAACSAMHALVMSAPIETPFVWGQHMWGTLANISKKTGKEWTHFHASVAPNNDILRTPDQKMAWYLEEMKVFRNAFNEYSLEVVDEGIRILESGNFARSKGPLANLKWYRQGLLGKKNPDMLWLAIVTAPPGFAHIRNNVVATLLDEIKSGSSFADAKRRWEEKMDPLAYQRSHKEATEGMVAAAQKLVAQLGVERSFERRFAGVQDIPLEHRIFAAQKIEETPGKLFGQLVKPGAGIKKMELPPTTVTWKQLREKLASARRVEINLPARGNYYGLLTAVHEDAPCLLRWNNHVSWYVYAGGSYATQWGLKSGWKEVDLVFEPPNLWGGHDAETKYACFAFREAHDLNASQLCLFPEILKSEYHPIRAVIEANNRTMSPVGRSTASGYAVKPDATESVRVDGVEYKVRGW